MNILIVSYEAWRETNNGGNVLSNIFGAFPDADIAQVYCSGEAPQNGICRKYFQISDAMLLTKVKGRRLEERDYSTDAAPRNKIRNQIPDPLREFALLGRELLWTCFDWRTLELEAFVREFAPDLIFAPCYSYFHVSKLALHVKGIARCPMISYISDDNYSLRQLHISPSFWINRIITRKWIRRHFAESSLVYTMTEAQKAEYGAMLGRPMKVLCKAGIFEKRSRETTHPIKFLYAGGLYLNRWRVLAELARAIRELNESGIRAQLHIYSGSKLKGHQKKRLHDGASTFLHGQISYGELMERYREADVAVHAESFDLRSRLVTRLSFSTKIIDCMNSGCAILAIGPGTQAGIAYLKEYDAAICVEKLAALSAAVRELTEHPERIWEYAEKARQLGLRNHSRAKIDAELRRDFREISGQV